jgi:Arc/MetJ family transcription regulator
LIDTSLYVDYNSYGNPHAWESDMRTVQMTLDEELLASVDEAAKKLHTTRSAFTRRALREALDRLTISELEQQHRRGYEQKPVRRGEFDIWEKEQAWGDS